MTCRLHILPQHTVIEAEYGANLLEVLRRRGMAPDAPCGGHGSCGKCRVLMDGVPVLACSAAVTRDAEITLPADGAVRILTDGIDAECLPQPEKGGFLLAFDIGTTTVVGYLLDGGTGGELGAVGAQNPQAAYGADVISRLQYAARYGAEALTQRIRETVQSIALQLCAEAGISPAQIGAVSIVGNPAMQQLFLGLDIRNLTQLPFAPVLTQAASEPAAPYLPALKGAELLTVPDISGYVGADTVACVLAIRPEQRAEHTLVVDIGTNGELVMASGGRMIACSAAAGPALEGAGIRFGMRAAEGAIDRVRAENGSLCCSVIGGGAAKGICGSGLIEAAAAALELGLINSRGRILAPEELDGERYLPLKDGICLTQSDIRSLQLAKGAIAAGIVMMAERLGIGTESLETVYLAGAFGSNLDPAAACAIGLLPGIAPERIRAVGNAAGSGAKLVVRSREELARAQLLTERIEFLELASEADFSMRYAAHMRF